MKSILSEETIAGPSDQLVESTVESMHVATRTPVSESPQCPNAIMRLPKLLAYTVGTVVLVSAFLGILVFSGQRSFAQVQENIRSSKVTKYRYSTSSLVEGSAQYYVCWVSDSALKVKRYDKSNSHFMTSIYDFETSTLLHLGIAAERALFKNLENELPKHYGNPLGIIEDISDGDATLVDTIQDNERTVDLYELSGLTLSSFGIATRHSPSGKHSFKAWVDRETQRPVKVLLHFAADKATDELRIEMNGFQWNVEVTPGMFSTSTPDGYELCEEFHELAEVPHSHEGEHQH